MDLTHVLNDPDDNDEIPIPPPPTETRASHTPYAYKWPQTPRDAGAFDAPEASGSQYTGVQHEQSGPRYCLNCKEPMVVFKLRCDPCKRANKERLHMMMAPPEFRFCIVCKASILGESVLCDTHREQEPLLTGHEKRILRDEGNGGFYEPLTFGPQPSDTQFNDSQQFDFQSFGNLSYSSQLDDSLFYDTQSFDTQSYGVQQYDTQSCNTQLSGSQSYNPQSCDTLFSDSQSYGAQSYSAQVREAQDYDSWPDDDQTYSSQLYDFQSQDARSYVPTTPSAGMQPYGAQPHRSQPSSLLDLNLLGANRLEPSLTALGRMSQRDGIV
ncbi:hypothetical protein ACHAPJ_005288 [Fusarium lateritium]